MMFPILVLVSALNASPVIDFSKTDNLKAVFDAGLRPWRLPGLEKYECMVTHQTLGMQLPYGTPFTLPVELASFGVLQGNQFSRIDIASEQMTVEQGVAKTREICQALGIETEGLERMVAGLPSRPSENRYWAGRVEHDGLRVQVSLDPLFHFDHITVKVLVMVDWNRPSKPTKFLKEPIKPPPGYEHISMEPPPPDPNRKPFPDPAYSFDAMVKRIEAAKVAEGRASTPALTATVPLGSTPKASRAVQADQMERSAPWLWIIGTIFLVFLIGAIGLKFLRR